MGLAISYDEKLKPGMFVRVKSKEDIGSLLNDRGAAPSWGEDRGLYFASEMYAYCGVSLCVKFVNESTRHCRLQYADPPSEQADAELGEWWWAASMLEYDLEDDAGQTVSPPGNLSDLFEGVDFDGVD